MGVPHVHQNTYGDLIQRTQSELIVQHSQTAEDNEWFQWLEEKQFRALFATDLIPSVIRVLKELAQEVSNSVCLPVCVVWPVCAGGTDERRDPRKQ